MLDEALIRNGRIDYELQFTHNISAKVLVQPDVHLFEIPDGQPDLQKVSGVLHDPDRHGLSGGF